ncbi:hypothetical protein RCL_jg9700.t1 [Rhizophagus clarus]|uniref:Uncharacterized protein n=1 Tax=Rhizophagus clarus TaxID=94130 RepID=A0A8H3M0I3_9GLOM|nr:hypothetical protein RCL_jg9700.t1 [Rhizophagus clarus]
MINNDRLGFRYSNLVKSAYYQNCSLFIQFFNIKPIDNKSNGDFAEKFTLNSKKLMSIPSYNFTKYESLMFYE